jgi:hypothetical protein
MMARGFAIAGAWLSLGMVLSASSCYQSDIDEAFPTAQNLQLQQREHWNAERQRELMLKAAEASGFRSNEFAVWDAGQDRLWRTGRSDCPGNACDKKKDDISTP